jgi:hypothetical protein
MPITLTTNNSYATHAEFLSYMDRIPEVYKSAFIAADPFQREQALVWATQLLDANILWPSGSYRRLETQTLQFPRIGIIDQDGWLVDELTVPQFIKDATCQLAFELLKSDLTTEPTTGIRALTVGPISIDFDINHAHDVKVIPRSVWSLLLPYGGVLRGAARIRSVPLYRS